MLAITGLHAGFLPNHLTDSSSEGVTSLGSAPATRQYGKRPCRIKTHEMATYSRGGSLKGRAGMLAISGLDGRFLYNRLTDFGSVTWTSLGSTPATCRYEVRLWRIGIHVLL